MGTSWGMDHITNNGEIIGTTSQDVRRVWAGLYSAGVVSGCQVLTSTTGMTYQVVPGVAVIKMADGENVIAPVPGGTLSAATNNTGGSRNDTIYVVQNTGTLNTVSMGVAQGSSIPQYAQAIATFSVPASATTTSQATISGSVPYSVPYGANLGLFFQKVDTANSTIPKGVTTTIAAGSFYLMTDRKCIFAADVNVSALQPDGDRAYRFDNSAYVELHIEVHIDGVREFVFHTPGLHAAWATYHYEKYVNLRAGLHTVEYKYYYGTQQGPGLVMRHHSGADANTGSTFSVRDGGFWEFGAAGDTV